MNVVNWFEIPVKKMQRAKQFYSNILAKELSDMPGMEMAAFPWETDAPFAAGALVKVEGLEPSPNSITVYFHSNDLSVERGKIEETGGKILDPKTSIGEHGFIAHFLDTEGNRIGLHSQN